ncbi:UDP-N-acetylglucosamine--N-acetylmuramyl-(pentapeptide) pyrophosphoryl-undecaprenol N-acetylglucosamine transferase [bacterium]|nr:UDP-N-acetylglucosamine--N-acetylmuramyl-(pentapeptide) pyrophosphoryl-undecaprenol N-acetylglucosamine transferase [bacterium]
MKEKKIKFVFTGGGSGGHVSPALAVAAELKKTLPEAEITYIGVKNKAEAHMVPKAGIPLKFVKSAPLPQGKSPARLLKFAVTMFSGLTKAALLLLKIRPAAVFATGGFVSAPTVFAAWILRKATFGLFKTRIMIHESNTDLGKMNKAAAKAADKVAVSFSETIRHLPKNKGFFSGYPVRSSIALEERSAARKELGIPDDAFVIFAFGGSQGSRTINRVLANSAKKLLENPSTYIIHGAGKPFGKVYEYHGFNDVSGILEKQKLSEEEKKRYLLRDFIDNMGLYYAASDLLVIRAGAGSIVEVCRQGKPSVIIPISNIGNDHQIGNARFIERAGAAAVIYERTDPLNGIDIAFADADEFCETVSKLRADKQKLTEMSEAAKNIFPGNPAEIIVKNLLYLCRLGEKPDEIKGTEFVNDRVLGLNSTSLEKFLQKTKSGAEKPLEADEIKLIKNKIDMLFSSRNPVIKARACRSSGILGYSEVIPLIIRYAADKNSAPFLSRDAFVALKQLSLVCETDKRDDLFKAIISGLENSYYETRFSAEKCIPAFAGHFGISENERGKFLELLFKNMTDHCFEVRAEAILAAAQISTDIENLLKHFSKLYFDAVWKVRMAILQAFGILIKRGVLNRKAAVSEIDRILITSNGYTTEYELKKEYNSVLELISQEKKS